MQSNLSSPDMGLASMSPDQLKKLLLEAMILEGESPTAYDPDADWTNPEAGALFWRHSGNCCGGRT